jgi:protein disulfide-isomerase
MQAAPAAATPAATVAAAASIAPPQLPAGAPPLGFEGYCPVTLKTQGKWKLGNASLGIVHRGRTYLFVSETERQQFWADPDAYSPVFAGLDPVVLLEKQQSVEGTRRFGWEYGGLYYLFSSEETKRRFESNPASYAAGVRQAMSRIDASEGGIIRR